MNGRRLANMLVGALAAAAGLAPNAEASSAEQLVVFVSRDDSAVSQSFRERTMPELEQLAVAQDLQLAVVDVARGAPPEIRCTPAIVFADHRGRSIYQGRTTTLERIGNFIQTARAVPQGSAELVRTLIPVAPLGRMKVAAPIKITPLTGTPPPDFDEAAFRDDALRAIASGMERFDLADRVELGRTDRMFYVDFHPYRAADGRLFVTTALFSQFHCHQPLFTRFGNPVEGSWDDRDAVLAKAAGELAERIFAAIDDPHVGDGFVPLGADVPVRTWEELGLPLPDRSTDVAAAAAAAPDLVVPRRWTVDAAANARRTAIQFRFPAPLDGYAGRATELSGEVTLDPSLTAASLAGYFAVRTDSVTMGEPALDDYLHGRTMLDASRHPESRFDFDSVAASADARIAFGSIVPVTLQGRFTMRGIGIPLQVPAQLEAVVGADGRPRLVLEGRWSVDLLEQFAMEGPDGPEEIRHVLVYTCNIVLEPADTDE